MKRSEKLTICLIKGNGFQKRDVMNIGGELMIVTKIVSGPNNTTPVDVLTLKPYRRSIFHVIYGFIVKIFRSVIKYFRDIINL